MSNASKDQNYISTLLATKNDTSGTTIPLQADPISHGLMINDGTTGSDFGPKNAPQDNNHVIAIMAVSTDGVTPVVLYADSSNNLLIQSS